MDGVQPLGMDGVQPLGMDGVRPLGMDGVQPLGPLPFLVLIPGVRCLLLLLTGPEGVPMM